MTYTCEVCEEEFTEEHKAPLDDMIVCLRCYNHEE